MVLRKFIESDAEYYYLLARLRKRVQTVVRRQIRKLSRFSTGYH